MLPAEHRMRSSRDFTEAVRRGRRAGRPTLVGHLAPGTPGGDGSGRAAPARVGFVVSRAVGDAVTRNGARRRLRSLVRDRLDALAPGSLLVVRAQPSSAHASSAALGADLDDVLSRLIRPSRSGARRS